jgi:RND family efflux transporter MFP subunit
LHRRRATLGLTAAWLAWTQAAAAAPPAGHDCLIEPAQTVELRSAVAGVIEKVHVGRGQSVKKGALLVSLSSEVERTAVALAQYKSSLQGAVQAAEGRLAHAERKVQRRGDLAALNYASAQESEDAQVERALAAADLVNAREAREVARLEYANALAQLTQRSLSSPIDGVVVDQALYAGELADPRDNKPYILKLAQIHPLRVRLILPVALYPRVRTGQRAEVTPEAPHEMRAAATVVSVDKVMDAASGTFQVRLELPNPAGTLPAGLKCRVTLPGL